MNNSKLNIQFKFGVSASVFLISLNSFSAGFEKTVMWSGHYAALGGAASSIVEGAESLYFNPAGLAQPHGIQVSANISPTFSQFSGPVVQSNTSISSNRSTSFPGSILASYQVSPKFTLGAGYYVSAGTKAVYENVNFGLTTLTPTVKTELTITEWSLGGGYEIIEGLRFGLAYRIVMVRGSLTRAAGNATAVGSTTFDDLSATRYNGFKLGLQYAPKDARWGLGAEWRTQVDFTANATANVSIASAAGVNQLPASSATLSAVFPQQISVGGYYDLTPKVLRLIGEYTFTEYGKNTNLNIGSSGGAITQSPLNWKNMSNFRLAGEYKWSEAIPIRLAYVLTTQVTPNSNANATYSSPGLGHTFTIGTGINLTPNLTTDAAFEYSRASGTVAASEAAAGTLAGDYSSNAFAFHLGATYQL